ncbi:MAG: hypothetical protein CL661_07150 [Bacteroidetes bacterium]|nr:hypothetical protein [Bacteroidota bacterium]|tara:strand:+ start:2610 stop:3050 length:441 start_codon:yes stop_codon:yes gene_type:complete
MKNIYLLTLMILFGLTICGQNLSTITVRVSNIELNGSKIFIALYDNENNFDQKLGTFDSLKIVSKTETIDVKFKDVKSGDYAVAVFQDLNNNSKLDKVGLNIPQEPVGISNYATNRILGRPKFKNAQFQVSRDTLILIPLTLMKKQ